MQATVNRNRSCWRGHSHCSKPSGPPSRCQAPIQARITLQTSHTCPPIFSIVRHSRGPNIAISFQSQVAGHRTSHQATSPRRSPHSTQEHFAAQSTARQVKSPCRPNQPSLRHNAVHDTARHFTPSISTPQPTPDRRPPHHKPFQAAEQPSSQQSTSPNRSTQYSPPRRSRHIIRIPPRRPNHNIASQAVDQNISLHVKTSGMSLQCKANRRSLQPTAHQTAEQPKSQHLTSSNTSHQDTRLRRSHRPQPVHKLPRHRLPLAERLPAIGCKAWYDVEAHELEVAARHLALYPRRIAVDHCVQACTSIGNEAVEIRPDAYMCPSIAFHFKLPLILINTSIRPLETTQCGPFC